MDRKEFWKRFKNGERDFSGFDLSNSSLYGFDLTGIILVEANLTGCDFVETKFYNANLERACFKGADLDGASFRNCNLRRANFDSSILVRASFSDCNGDEAFFTNIDETAMAGFHDSSFKRSVWSNTAVNTECVLSDIDLTGAIDCPIDQGTRASRITLPNGEVVGNMDER
ncbi:MAG: pentapeptide repeat-containing protein [Cyanobacteria bacterium J06623_1]